MSTDTTERAIDPSAQDLFVRSDEELRSLCRMAEEDGVVGLDTEFIPERTYYPQLALVQLAIGETLKLVDPLGTVSLSPLDRILLDEGVTVVVHGGEQDMGIFHHRLGRPVTSVYDTQVACSFLGLGAQISYGNMVSSLLGVQLEKGEAYTDWLRRPLTDKQRRYALNDVRYLLPCQRILATELKKKGRGRWVAEELGRYDRAGLYEVPVSHAHRKVRKAGGLRGHKRGVFEELAAWRELEARKRDLPRRKVLSDEVLVLLAKAAPGSAAKLERVSGVNPRVVRKYGRPLLDAVRKGLARAPEENPKPRTSVSSRVKAAVDLLQLCLQTISDDEGIGASNIATKSELEALAADHFDGGVDRDEHQVLKGWRGQLAGGELMACLKGELSLGLDGASGEVVFLGGVSAPGDEDIP